MRYVTAACGGELLAGSPESLVSRVGSDSRQARAGDLFIALAGEKFDGHVFVAEVALKGAVAVMIERAKMPAALPGPCAVIAVDNTRQALGRLAARYRADFDLPVIAV
ncbi:MAG TPA: Mur ligase domain-containing protein, partial [Verrucomicrobiae bacterium]|nr:Mur ligase domain-containing protein [Verrucomicrobiae bacterium]